MLGLLNSSDRSVPLRAIAGGLLAIICTACAADGGPSSADALMPDSAAAATSDSSVAAPIDSTLAAPDTAVPTGLPSEAGVILDTRARVPGIVFGSVNMDATLISSVHTGTQRGGGLSPSNILSVLSAVRSRGGRIVLKLCMGKDSYVKNADGTFSFSKWQQLVSRYRSVNLAPYINDGTIVGHYLIDEPQRDSRWGGKIIPPSTLEAMAKYSKQIWPTMTTFVRVVPSWLASAPITYTYLDAGWAQYAAGKGDIGSWIAAEAAAGKRKGLGLAVGLNVMDGGNGSSRIRGITAGRYAMSATELRNYGGALLNQSYSCAFYNWTYDGTYYGRSDIKSAMAALSLTAKSHAKTSCRQ